MLSKKNTVTTKQEKQREENKKAIQKQEAEVKQLKQESKKHTNPKASLMTLMEGLANVIFKKKMGGDRAPKTAQQTLCYQEMYKDGLCRVTDTFYSKTISYHDINFQLMSNGTKENIFNRYCSFLDSIPPNIHLQMSFHSTLLDADELEKAVTIKRNWDELDEIRLGYGDFLKKQIHSDKNLIKKAKYITFGTNADSPKLARQKLNRVEKDFLKIFDVQLDASPTALDGTGRLLAINDVLRDSTKHNPKIDFESLKKRKTSEKDIIAPSSFWFQKPQAFLIGSKWARASSLIIDSNQLFNNALVDMLDCEGESVFSIHLTPYDQQKATRLLKRIISDLGAAEVEHNKKANREGYSMEILPPDLESQKDGAMTTLRALEEEGQHYFTMSMTVLNFGKNRSEMESHVSQLTGIAASHGLLMKPASFEQEQGLISALPFGHNLIKSKRDIITAGVAALVPFNVGDISMGKDALCYGVNEITKQLIMVDRSELTNPNGIVVGTSGSGKSVACKIEIAAIKMKKPNESIIILDPEGEYKPLIQKMGGTILRLSVSSELRVNPLDINENYGVDSENEDIFSVQMSAEKKKKMALSFKADLILGLFEIMLEGDISPHARSMIDKAMRFVYTDYFNDPVPENMPILEDMYNFFMQYTGEEDDSFEDATTAREVARNIGLAMEIFVHGSLNYFNARTNVDMENTIICFNIQELQSQLRDFGMLVIQDTIWNRVTMNRNLKRKTWYYIDEFHLLLRTEQTRAYMVEIWKRFRKWGGIPTAITQNVKEFVETSVDAKNILDNTQFFRLMQQMPQDGRIIADYLDISDDLLAKVLSPSIGGGLLRAGRTIVPFNNELPTDNALFKYITTKLEDSQ